MSKMPNIEKLTEANAAAIANLEDVANTALAAIESLSVLNINFARGSLEKSSKHAHKVLNLKSVQELHDLKADSFHPGVESVVAYAQGLYDIANGAASEINGKLKKQFQDLSDKVQTAAESSAKASPFASDVILAAIKHTVEANEAAYANLRKAVKHASDVAEENIKKVTSVAIKAAKHK